MGDLLYRLKDGENIPVEPIGSLVSDGWLPGTWVSYSTTAHYITDGAIATVEISDGEGVIAGFLITGPQHDQPVEQLSDMWTTDTRQRDGGSTHTDWSGFDAGGPLEFDKDGLLQRLGSRVATMGIPPTGFYKFYVFETENLAERTTPGTGAALTYAAGDKLYVSSRGRLTSEQEQVAHPWTAYVVARFDTDEEGDYIIAVAAVA